MLHLRLRLLLRCEARANRGNKTGPKVRRWDQWHHQGVLLLCGWKKRIAGRDKARPPWTNQTWHRKVLIWVLLLALLLFLLFTLLNFVAFLQRFLWGLLRLVDSRLLGRFQILPKVLCQFDFYWLDWRLVLIAFCLRGMQVRRHGRYKVALFCQTPLMMHV